jgi:hypothetical protein
MAGHLLPFVYGGMVEQALPQDVPGLLDSAAAATAGLDVCQTCSMALHIAAAAALVQIGDLDGARGHLGIAEQTAGRWSGGDWAAAVLEARATLHRGEGAADGRPPP